MAVQLNMMPRNQRLKFYHNYLTEQKYGYRFIDMLSYTNLLIDWAEGRVPEVYAYRKLSGGRGHSCGRVIDISVHAPYGRRTLKVKIDYDDDGRNSWVVLENIEDIRVTGVPERNPPIADVVLFTDHFGRDLNVGEMVSLSERGKLAYAMVHGYTPSGHQIILDVFYVLTLYSKIHNIKYQKNKEKGGGLVIVEDEFVKKQLLLQSLGYSGNQST